MNSWRVAAFAALVLSLLSARASAATTNCPWVTQGSVAKALGGAVTASVQVSASGEGSCIFTRQEAPNDTLKIVVSKAAVESCPAESDKPKGIGNEAALCKVQRSKHEAVELLASRVLAFHFTVSLSLADDPQNTGVSRAQETVKQIGEQVAGNLF
jgi:hypothetical protein